MTSFGSGVTAQPVPKFEKYGLARFDIDGCRIEGEKCVFSKSDILEMLFEENQIWDFCEQNARLAWDLREDEAIESSRAVKHNALNYRLIHRFAVDILGVRASTVERHINERKKDANGNAFEMFLRTAGKFSDKAISNSCNYQTKAGFGIWTLGELLRSMKKYELIEFE